MADVVTAQSVSLEAAPPELASPEPAPLADQRAKRMRGLIGLGRARTVNAFLRLGASAVVAVVTISLLDNYWPGLWYAGLIAVVLLDRRIFARLVRRCEAGEGPDTLRGYMLWTTLQSVYGNIPAVMLWFAPYVPGETLAVMYLCGGLANGAATLRYNSHLAACGMGPTIGILLGLPLAEYLIDGAHNTLNLTPLVGGLLLLGFCVNLWRSLLESDAAQAQAEAAAIRERQAAAAAAAAKSEVIRRMNDELRTPMAALVGAAEHLRRAAATPQARAHIAGLAQAGEVLKLVLDDLSDLDRLENGKLRVAPAPADPRDVLRGVVGAFRAAAQDKNLELFLDFGPHIPPHVVMDAARVRQVLFNLLANAVRYTNHGGVRVRLQAQAAAEGRTRLSFIIADTGPGMSRARLSAVLGRERMCADGDGPGLGLAISVRLARLMGGRIGARSEVGQGSVFSFSLDAAICAAPAESTEAA